MRNFASTRPSTPDNRPHEVELILEFAPGPVTPEQITKSMGFITEIEVREILTDFTIKGVARETADGKFALATKGT